MSGSGEKLSGTKTPADFLKSIRGRPVVVKLNSGVDYRGDFHLNLLPLSFSFIFFSFFRMGFCLWELICLQLHPLILLASTSCSCCFYILMLENEAALAAEHEQEVTLIMLG